MKRLFALSIFYIVIALAVDAAFGLSAHASAAGDAMVDQVGQQASQADSVTLAKVLPVSNERQAGFKDLVEKGLYKEALGQWDGAYGAANFADTPTGQAYLALLLFRNNVPVTGFTKLMAIANPENIIPALKTIWAAELPANHQIWRVESDLWNDRFKVVFPQVVSVQAAWKVHNLKTDQEIKYAESVLSKLDPDSEPAAWVQWQLALADGIKRQEKIAGFYLQELLDSKQTLVSHDRVLIESARLFFQDGKFDFARKYYDMIPKDSDLWLEAVEERAWISIREHKYDEALAQVKTLKAPLFASQVGPEPFYVEGVADIKLCDYFGAFKMLKDFRGRFQLRVPELQKLAKTGSTPEALQAEDLLESGRNPLALNSALAKLPRLFYRDEVIERFSRAAQSLKQETVILGQWKDSEHVTMNVLREQAQGNYQTARQASLNRMKDLARADVAELSSIVRKLHIVEVEAIQRMFPREKLAAQKRKGAKAVSSDALVFPDDGEVWLDELDHYRMTAQGCPTKL